MLSHANLLDNARTLVEAWRFTADDVLLHALPIFHTHGLFVACNTVMVSGGSMIFLPKFDADAIIAGLPQATSMMGVPTFYTRLLAREDAELSEESVKVEIADKLARFKQPKRVFFVPELPRNTMGKVQKNVLRDEHSGESAAKT